YFSFGGYLVYGGSGGSRRLHTLPRAREDADDEQRRANAHFEDCRTRRRAGAELRIYRQAARCDRRSAATLANDIYLAGRFPEIPIGPWGRLPAFRAFVGARLSCGLRPGALDRVVPVGAGTDGAISAGLVKRRNGLRWHSAGEIGTDTRRNGAT